MRTYPLLAVCLAMICGTAGPGHALDLAVLAGEIQLWEDGGFPPSNLGDVLHGCGQITVASAPLLLDFADHEYTFHLTGAVSSGQFEDLGNIIAFYSGGSIDVWADAYDGAGYTASDYGINPPNGTAPATFSDGIRYLQGEISLISIQYNTVAETGSMTLQCNLTLESSLGVLDNTEAFIAGSLSGSSAQVIEGYDLVIDSGLEYDDTLPVASTTWSDIKSLFR